MMIKFKHNCHGFFLSLFTTLVVLSSGISHAAPGTLADEPLFLSTVAPPNIMFLLDDSGSMSNIVPDVPFDASVTYATCPAGLTIDPTAIDYIDIQIESDGDSYFMVRTSNDDYDWGTVDDGSGRDEGCFYSALDYLARLYGASGGEGDTKTPSNYLWAQYTGNYLNWYFGVDGPNWGAEARKKPGTATRMEIAQATLTSLMGSLNNVRVGLSSYDYIDGAVIDVGIDDIDDNRSTMISKINTLSLENATPLAESLHEIGRYFTGFAGASSPGNQTTSGLTSNGQYDSTLTLHPGQGNETSLDHDTVFNRTPELGSGVSGESPILHFCQSNFAMLLTDGRPQYDQDITSSTGLGDYDGDCASGCDDLDKKPSRGYESLGSDYLDDVAKALFEIDLRPISMILTATKWSIMSSLIPSALPTIRLSMIP